MIIIHRPRCVGNSRPPSHDLHAMRPHNIYYYYYYYYYYYKYRPIGPRPTGIADTRKADVSCYQASFLQAVMTKTYNTIAITRGRHKKQVRMADWLPEFIELCPNSEHKLISVRYFIQAYIAHSNQTYLTSAFS